MTRHDAITRYTGHGLVVDSEVELALRERAGQGESADITLRWDEERPVGHCRPAGSPLAEVIDRTGSLYFSVTRHGDAVVLRYPELCEFVGDRGLREVRVALHPGADRGLVSVLGSGALIAIHLALRGDLVLHASCVEVRETALAFTGASGMGKSTMAALMAGAGFPLVSDDVLRTSIGPGPLVTVHSGGVEGRLRDKARELASAVHGATTRPTADGRLSLRPELTSLATLPLGACVIPLPSRGTPTLSVRRLRSADALRRLLQFPRVVGWSDPEILRSQFDAAADLAMTMPVYEADVPWGPPFDDDLPRRMIDAIS